MKKLANCHDINDLRKAAKKRLPKTIFDFLDGGADDEVSLRHNRYSFDQYTLVPDALTDVSKIDMSTKVMGQEVSFPFILSPTGMSRIFHHEGEKAVAQAAAKAGLIYSLSSNSSVSIEEIGHLTTGPKWFQIYVWKDRSLVKSFISRARQANFQALCLTIDVQVYGNRQRDLYNGMATPIQLTPKLVLDLARHPNWLYHMLSKGQPNLANLPSDIGAVNKRVGSRAKYINSQFDRSVTWKDAEWMINEWGGPFAIKGILNVQDAIRAVKIGATGIVVSNHGGRQLDVSVWKDSLPAQDCGDEAAAWFEALLGRACRLVQLSDNTQRQVNRKYAEAGEWVGFADGYPLLVTTEESLDVLSQAVGRPLDMLRFRPNIVLAGVGD